LFIYIYISEPYVIVWACIAPFGSLPVFHLWQLPHLIEFLYLKMFLNNLWNNNQPSKSWDW
jgi:hypothetical protein